MTAPTLTLTLPWFHDAPDRACVGIPTNEFFPEKGDHPTAQAAKRVCRACPYQHDCAAFALTHLEDGIWGATSPFDRRKTRRHQGNAL